MYNMGVMINVNVVSPNVEKLNLSDFKETNQIIGDLENRVGSQWVFCVCTDNIKEWKNNWKDRMNGLVSNKPLIRLRNSKDPRDLLLYEGSIWVGKSLYNLSSVLSNLNSPMPSDFSREKFLVTCSQQITIIDSKKWRAEGKITSSLLNDTHFANVSLDGNTVLVTSSGAGKIVEFDIKSGEILWIWDADEFASKYQVMDPKILKLRRKFFTYGVDYRNLAIQTPAQISHVNTAVWLNSKEIGVTLFHQGMSLIVNKRTRKVRIIAQGMSKPHGFQLMSSGEYVITDTGNERLLIFSKEFVLKKEITGFANRYPKDKISWLQMAYSIDDYLVAIDQTLNQFIFIDIVNMKIQRSPYDDNWKVSYLTRI